MSNPTTRNVSSVALPEAMSKARELRMLAQRYATSAPEKSAAYAARAAALENEAQRAKGGALADARESAGE